MKNADEYTIAEIAELAPDDAHLAIVAALERDDAEEADIDTAAAYVIAELDRAGYRIVEKVTA